METQTVIPRKFIEKVHKSYPIKNSEEFNTELKIVFEDAKDRKPYSITFFAVPPKKLDQDDRREDIQYAVNLLSVCERLNNPVEISVFNCGKRIKLSKKLTLLEYNQLMERNVQLKSEDFPTKSLYIIDSRYTQHPMKFTHEFLLVGEKAHIDEHYNNVKMAFCVNIKPLNPIENIRRHIEELYRGKW